ncbi:MAG TPA: acylphosphatase [Lacipirellulaceae bacterium]|jgi:acylphosphatase|nr:acylphosphatase [Lacipirellulaceae bacterium]
MAKQGDERSTVHYTGNVQGVGFRYTTRSIAQRFAVTGHVQNLPDGRVKLVAEGTPTEIKAFLKGVRERLCDHVRDERTDVGPATGEFDGFEIQH